jgi:hypothetical protein
MMLRLRLTLRLRLRLRMMLRLRLRLKFHRARKQSLRGAIRPRVRARQSRRSRSPRTPFLRKRNLRKKVMMM